MVAPATSPISVHLGLALIVTTTMIAAMVFQIAVTVVMNMIVVSILTTLFYIITYMRPMYK